MERDFLEVLSSSQEMCERMLNNMHRPKWHFNVPYSTREPVDPNGAFYADGLYHLMFLYHNVNTNAFHWGHTASADLLHWHRYPDALAPALPMDEETPFKDCNRGCNSGGAFVDEDGTAYIAYWKIPEKDGGIGLAVSKSPYTDWKFIYPLIISNSDKYWGTADMVIDGEVRHIGCADPSNIWKKDGYYYMQLGNCAVLKQFGEGENGNDFYKGDWTELFRSKDLKKWEYVKRFYENPHIDSRWPDLTEDDMCPCFLPLPDKKSGGRLTDKWLQLFISHNKSAQYYVGRLENETFVPEQHGRFNYSGNFCTAPEALLDDKNRQIGWLWIEDSVSEEFKENGWENAYTFPRCFWYENNTLHMSPVDELEKLQCNYQNLLGDGDFSNIALKNGMSFRMKAVLKTGKSDVLGFAVKSDSETGEQTLIYVDVKKEMLVVDAEKSGREGKKAKAELPFKLEKGELLELDILVDGSVVEVYANRRRAVCARVYPEHPERATAVKGIGIDMDNVCSLEAWEILQANQL